MWGDLRSAETVYPPPRTRTWGAQRSLLNAWTPQAGVRSARVGDARGWCGERLVDGDVGVPDSRASEAASGSGALRGAGAEAVRSETADGVRVRGRYARRDQFQQRRIEGWPDSVIE